MDQKERIIEIEIKLTEALRLSEELSDIVAQQANRLDVDLVQQQEQVYLLTLLV